VPATVLRPVMFMEVLADPTYGIEGTAPVIQTIPPDATVQLIALDDVGALAALSFAEPERFLGRVIELAGDELTQYQLLAALARTTGREITGTHPAPAGGPTSSFCGWQADIPALRSVHPALLDLDAWLTRQGRALLAKHLSAAGAR